MSQQTSAQPLRHNLDAEESVLGAMMLSAHAIDAVSGVLNVRDFYRPSNGLIFEAAVALHERGEPVDSITVTDELDKRGKLEAVGDLRISGADRVHELAALVPAAANAAHYARIVAEESRRRDVIAFADELKTLTLAGADLARIAETVASFESLRLAAVPGTGNPVSGEAFLLDVPDVPTAVWGDGDRVLWAAGEPLLIVGPDGVGKTSLAQQLMLRRAGAIGGPLLGLPVVEDRRPVLYVAADRPQQAKRSLGRMVGPETVRDGLYVWKGPLDFDVAAEPSRLAALATELGVGTVVLDSLKDLAADLASDEAGSGVARAIQLTIAAGVEVVVLHHERKGQNGAPKTIADVYGSRWLTAVCGSVILLWGDPGANVVKLRHLKQPAETVGPLALVHDHAAGTIAVAEAEPEQPKPSLVDRVIEHVTEHPGCTKRDVLKDVTGGTDPILAAVAEGIAHGLLRAEKGLRNSEHLYPASERSATPKEHSETLPSPVFPLSVPSPSYREGRNAQNTTVPEDQGTLEQTGSTSEAREQLADEDIPT